MTRRAGRKAGPSRASTIEEMKLAVLTASLALLAAPSARATATTGLHGIVLRGPVTPVCVAEQPCYEPAVGAVLTFSRAGTVIARARVGSGGRYRVVLKPGLYTVRASHRIDPTTARVRSGRMTRLDFSIDTGIR
jgi:hypothetical protein